MITTWNKYLSVSFLLFILLIQHIKCRNAPPKWSPITVSLYYEALSPACQYLIVKDIGEIYNKYNRFMKLEMIPWGHSKFRPDGTIRCRHGSIECEANKLQSCVLEYAEMKHALAFIICFERSLLRNTGDIKSAIKHCSGFIRNRYEQIRKCYNSKDGIQLQQKAYYRTKSVKAGHFPYLVLKGSTLGEPNPMNINEVQSVLKKWDRIFGNQSIDHAIYMPI
uniref:Gamma interferon inducible lysosomal thiol reductase GILT n=1 Tax=Loa loa TaxID=7209 RepID=A0A1I7W3S9_LOALO